MPTEKTTAKTTKKATERTIWNLEVQYLKGVGPKLASQFAKAGIHTLWDLLLFLPKRYEDRRRFQSYSEIQQAALEEGTVMGFGVVEKYVQRRAGARGRRWTEALLRVVEVDEQGRPRVLDQSDSILSPRIQCTWFGRSSSYVEKSFPPGSEIVFRGKVKVFRSQIQMAHPEFHPTAADLPEWEFGSIVPVYKEIGGLSNRLLRKVLALAAKRNEVLNVPESLPASVQEKLQLRPLGESLKELHFPKKWEPKVGDDSTPEGEYFKRLAFEELFMMAATMSLAKSREESEISTSKLKKAELNFEESKQSLDELAGLMPFNLTGDQKKALDEILGDMTLSENQIPMNRLLQGDVGSGKTAIAFLSALLLMKKGYQVAMMAPTEVLANQHYENFSKLFPEFSNQALMLKGALTEKSKKLVRSKLASGECSFVIGTQALISDTTLFEKLALIIVDEQHRFGVRQRIRMKGRSEGVAPHFLAMTATPIPRSLALTVYGDLSLSVVREKPAGRQEIETHLVKQRAHEKLSLRLKEFADEGRQIYLVYPLVEESEEMDLKDVKSAFSDWQSLFGEEAVGLLHGKMKSKDKDRVMRDFSDGKIKVLVTTTVIEVGVDVPNASVIVIEHAERFGLSQLHQLRGRVGRGDQKSFCILVGPDNPGPTATQRLNALVDSGDGFVIAEKDLEIRGPGEFLGQRQSGLPGFRVAHIIRDLELLEQARSEAARIFQIDPLLEKEENQNLKRMMDNWWADRIEMATSG